MIDRVLTFQTGESDIGTQRDEIVVKEKSGGNDLNNVPDKAVWDLLCRVFVHVPLRIMLEAKETVEVVNIRSRLCIETFTEY